MCILLWQCSTLQWGELGFRSSKRPLRPQTCLWLKRTGLGLSDLAFQCFHLRRCELLIRNSWRSLQTASCLAYVGVNYSNYYIPFVTSDSAQRNLPGVMGQGAFDSSPSAGFGEETSELCLWICGWDSSKTLARTFKHLCGSHSLCVKQEEQWTLQEGWIPLCLQLGWRSLECQEMQRSLWFSVCDLSIHARLWSGLWWQVCVWLMITNRSKEIHTSGRKCSKIRGKSKSLDYSALFKAGLDGAFHLVSWKVSLPVAVGLV